MAETTPRDDCFTDTQIARMLGVNPVTVRQWRVKNKKAGEIKHGPPYEIRGNAVVYPKPGFRAWCAAVKVEGGVPITNLPPSANISAIQQATANGSENDSHFQELGRLAG